MSFEVENVYRRNKDNKLSVVTKWTARDIHCVLQWKEVKIACAAAAVGGEGDNMIVIINHNNKSSPFSGTGG